MTNQELFDLLRKIDDGYEPVRDELAELSEIEKIIWNDIDEIPESIRLLTGLKELKVSEDGLSRFQLKSLPDSIGLLRNLQSLDVSYTQLSELPESIGGLINLRSLNLRGTQLSVLPESIGSLKNLQDLALSGSSLSELPESTGNLENLTNLSLSDVRLSELPGSLAELTSLQSLSLSSYRLSELPDWIGNLKSLKNLSLSSYNTGDLPESLGDLTNLQSLALIYFPISVLPGWISNLTNLQSLDMRFSRISELPDCIGDLSDLRSLDLSGTQLKELPERMGNLTNLQSLDLGGTQLKELPDWIGNLTNLRSLSLSGTWLSELPESIGKLPALSTLFLEDLILSEIPESFLNLGLEFRDAGYSPWKYSSGIYIKGLKLKNQPVEIFSQSRDLIIEYYRSCKSNLPINECKVVFLGDGGAGKTLMINRLLHDGIITPDFNGESTPGICIRSKKYRIGQDEIELHFWDFGGQAIMHSMHRLFLTNRTLYVVVANARDNKANEQAWYWIRNIRSFANGAPVLLLVNQKDQNPSANVNVNGLRKEYPELKEVRIVSALMDTQEEFNSDIRNVICRIVSGMDTVHTPFSKSWLSLMNNLQKMPEDYITSDDFYSKCRENGVEVEEKLLDEIISWYQDLGVCFYSKKHPAAGQYMVLKPRWLLNALYVLAFNGRKYAENGIIRETDIYKLICEDVSDDSVKRVWREIEYKPYEIQYIITVLLNFSLIYRLNNDRFFIPMLCDENEPEDIDVVAPEDVFHVFFKYDYLPENVLHQLMVRYGYELDMSLVWKTGAAFARRECGWRSLVRIRENCLDLYAKADNQAAHPVNSYLEMLRESICAINDGLGLEADEYIAYREGGREDCFEYDTLVGSKESGIEKIYSRVFKRALNINDILGNIRNPGISLTDKVIEQMLSSLSSMSLRCADLEKRDEVTLTADFQDNIEAVLNAQYGIQIAREYTLGRAKKRLGETDLYFSVNYDGKKQSLYVLENKVIKDFSRQYGQLMGYLNPYFSAGITLSVNKDRGWEDAFDFLYDKLREMKEAGEPFAPISIHRVAGENGTRYLKTKHVVPETGNTMPVYHLVLQLSDKDRKQAAEKARKRDNAGNRG